MRRFIVKEVVGGYHIFDTHKNKVFKEHIRSLWVTRIWASHIADKLEDLHIKEQKELFNKEFLDYVRK